MIIHDKKYPGGRRYVAATERADLEMQLIFGNLPTDWIKEKESPVHGTLYYVTLWADAAKKFPRRDLYR